jgi:hypothetical protein
VKSGDAVRQKLRELLGSVFDLAGHSGQRFVHPCGNLTTHKKKKVNCNSDYKEGRFQPLLKKLSRVPQQELEFWG